MSTLQVNSIKDASDTKTLATLSSSAVILNSDVTYPAISKASYTSSDATINSSGVGSGVIRQVQTNQFRSYSGNNNTSFDGTNSGTGMAVVIDNVLAGSNIYVSASFCWFITSGNVAYFTFFKRYDSGSGFNAEAQVSVVTATRGISGGLQHAGGESNYNGTTDMATIAWTEENVSAGRWQFELHRRCDSSSGTVGINSRGQNTSDPGTATIIAMEMT